MSAINVLVVFYSRYGAAEQLALAAGLGAIQANANIRLRRVADLADAPTIDAEPSWREHLDRMNRDYVAPRPADPVWADVIVLATPADSSTEIEAYCDSLRSLGTITGKIAAPLAAGHHVSALEAISAAAARAGMLVEPAPATSGDAVTAAREFGFRVAELARSRKAIRAQPAGHDQVPPANASRNADTTSAGSRRSPSTA